MKGLSYIASILWAILVTGILYACGLSADMVEYWAIGIPATFIGSGALTILINKADK